MHAGHIQSVMPSLQPSTAPTLSPSQLSYGPCPISAAHMSVQPSTGLKPPTHVPTTKSPEMKDQQYYFLTLKMCCPPLPNLKGRIKEKVVSKEERMRKIRGNGEEEKDTTGTGTLLSGVYLHSKCDDLGSIPKNSREKRLEMQASEFTRWL